MTSKCAKEHLYDPVILLPMETTRWHFQYYESDELPLLMLLSSI